MSTYLPSDAVTVFPCAKPRTSNLESNRLYERSLSASIKQLYPENITGFVINPNAVSVTLSGNILQFLSDFEFSLGGYYCKLSKDAELPIDSSHNYIYAVLHISNDTYEIIGQDDTNTYKGLQIITTEEQTAPENLNIDTDNNGRQTVLSLCLLSRQYSSLPFTVPAESIYDSLNNLRGIDGQDERTIDVYA